MNRIYIILILLAPIFFKSQIRSIGCNYTSIPLSNTFLLNKANLFGIRIDFEPTKKFYFGTFVFYGTNDYQTNYTSETRFNVQTENVFDGQERVTSFSGTQLDLGAAVYYILIEKQKFQISLGISPTVIFYTKAKATVGTIYIDTLESTFKFKINTYTTNNYKDLRDEYPDVLLINLNLKLQYSITKQLSIYTEPFISAFGSFKTYNSIFETVGINSGLSWAIRKPKANSN